VSVVGSGHVGKFCFSNWEFELSDKFFNIPFALSESFKFVDGFVGYILGFEAFENFIGKALCFWPGSFFVLLDALEELSFPEEHFV
jgi:hypothetical protein